MSLRKRFDRWWNPGVPAGTRSVGIDPEAYRAVPLKRFLNWIQYRKRKVEHWSNRDKPRWNTPRSSSAKVFIPRKDVHDRPIDEAVESNFMAETNALIDEYYELGENIRMLIKIIMVAAKVQVCPATRLDVFAPKLRGQVLAELKKDFRFSANAKPVVLPPSVFSKGQTVEGIAKILLEMATQNNIAVLTAQATKDANSLAKDSRK